jgi:GGDEF-like domain
LLSIVSNEIREVGLDPQLQLDVFEQIATIKFGYIDFLSQQVVATYQGEREHWLENRNRMRAVRVREVLDEAVIDVDAVTKEIRYPLSRTHLALVLWFPSDEATGNELGRLERFVRELTESMETLGAPLFVAADRVTGWAWIPLGANTARDATEQVRRFAGSYPDSRRIAVGTGRLDRLVSA